MRSRFSNVIYAVIVAAATALSAVGCLISGFDLKMQQMLMLVTVTVLFAVIGAVGFSIRRGWIAVLGVTAAAAVFLWMGGDALTQMQALLTRLTYTYDRAYHWGVIAFSGAWIHVASDLPMMILSVLIVLAVTWVLCQHRNPALAVAAAVLPLLPCLVVTDTPPHTACLFFLLIGIVTVLFTASMRKRERQTSPRMTLTATVAVFAAFALLFTAVPQKGYRNPFAAIQDQLLEMIGYESGAEGAGGKVDGVDLKGLGSRFFLQYPVLTVTAPYDGVVYLREQDYNIYNGYSWDTEDTREDGIAKMPYGEGVNAQKLKVETRWLRSRLFVPYYVTGSVHLKGGMIANTDKDQEYSWSVLPTDANWRDQVPQDGSASHMDWDLCNTNRYRSIPVGTLDWAQEFLATILTDEQQSATAKADAIAQYVHDMAFYADDCERMPSSEKDFARWFIENGKSGYCVHFATSTAVLLRAAGVSTRYVTGYMVSAKANEPTVVTADMEHAWVEYFEPALNRWIVLESTPPEQEQTEETEATTVPTTTTRPDTEPTQPTQPTAPQDEGSSIPWRKIFAVAGTVMLYVLGAAAIVALVIGQRVLRQAHRNRRWTKSTPNERALMLWREIGRMARRAAATPSEEADALAQKAKYSQHTLTQEELQCLSDERDALIQVLRTRSMLTRFVHRYILGLY